MSILFSYFRYGDVAPQTQCGRVICLLCGILFTSSEWHWYEQWQLMFTNLL